MPEHVISSESKVSSDKESIYASFQHAARQLDGLIAVDYFFAKEISQCLGLFGANTSNQEASQLTSQETEQQQWFHLLVALSASLRDGHSCLPLAQVAGKRCFTDGINQSETSTKGFLFSDLETLTALMANYP